jgi:hypothetical protein
MSDVALDAPAPLKVSVTFERSVGLPGYNNFAKARAWAEGDLPASADAAEVVATQHRLFEATKIEVFNQLGIAWEFDNAGFVVETPKVQALVEISTDDAAARLTEAFKGATQAPTPAPPDDLGTIPADVQADIRANPSDYWDNRASKTKDSQPDFKRKSDGKGFWIKPRSFK